MLPVQKLVQKVVPSLPLPPCALRTVRVVTPDSQETWAVKSEGVANAGIMGPEKLALPYIGDMNDFM
jgi:hypothetical protein